MGAQRLDEDQQARIQDDEPDVLEDADAFIPLARAAVLSGVTLATLTEHAAVGRLKAVDQDGVWWTTRRKLHVYLLNDLGDHRDRPLPAGYVAPDGEPRRKLRHYIVH